MPSSTGSTDSTTIPWRPQRDPYKSLYDAAEGVRDRPLEYYPGSTVADRNAWSTMANQNVADMVNQGSTGLDTAVAQNEKTASGYYLTPDSNPYLKEFGDAAASDISRQYMRTVQPGIASRFGGSGRSTGAGQGMSSAEGAAMASANRDLGQELSQMYSGLYGGMYDQERGRQENAVGMAGDLRGAQFADQAALSAAGADEWKYAQLQLSDMVNRWNFEQYEPSERLGLYQSLISQPGGVGSTSGSSQLGGLQVAGMIGSVAAPTAGSLAESYAA
jgi:hypothetical protein